MEAASVRRDPVARPASSERVERSTTETKHAFKTTEFFAMVGVIAAILVSAALIKSGATSGDGFVAKQAWLYVAIVASAYIISRGLAKSGSSEPYTKDRDGS